MKPKTPLENIKTLSNTYSYLSFRLSALKALYKDGGQSLFNSFQAKYNKNFQILRYERIVEPDSVLFPIPKTSYVTPATFAKHCKCLRKFCNVISLPTLLHMLKDGSAIPERSVVITIDGGYLDGFLNCPIPLTENALNATFFISTSYIGSNTLYPEDRIAYICERLKLAGEKIIRTDSTKLLFEQFKENENLQFIEYNAEGINSILKLYRSLSPEKGELVIRTLGEYAQHAGALAAPEPDFMEWKDLSYLQSLGFHIGSMGHSFTPSIHFKEDQIANDYTVAKSLLDTAEIDSLEAVSTPYNILSDTAIDAIASLNIEFILAGQSSQLQLEVSPIILSRKNIMEATTFSTDLFLKYLWS